MRLIQFHCDGDEYFLNPDSIKWVRSHRTGVSARITFCGRERGFVLMVCAFDRASPGESPRLFNVGLLASGWRVVVKGEVFALPPRSREGTGKRSVVIEKCFGLSACIMSVILPVCIHSLSFSVAYISKE